MYEKRIVDLYAHLDVIRECPAMYLGVLSLQRLQAYIGGMLHHNKDHDDILEIVSDPPLGDFHDFVRDKYGFGESTSGWCNMLIAVETTRSGVDQADNLAVSRFFHDLDEFRKL